MRNERGVVLLEVLAAVLILASAGLSLVALLAGATRAGADARRYEQQMADAERLLTAYTLLTRTELEQRLGDRRVGAYVVNIQRPEPSLYRISVSNLVTVVYRDVPSDR
jgi:type II secretory pathway pseudopilin PulG